MLLLTDREVAEAISGPDAVARSIELIEDSFRSYAEGEAGIAPLASTLIPPTAKSIPESTESFHAISGIVPSLDAVAMRFWTLRTPRKDAPYMGGSSGHRYWKALFDFETLDLICLFEDIAVHPYLVGAHVAVATKRLARADASIVGLIGSGKYAKGSLRAIAAVRSVKEVRVFSPNPENRARFAAEHTAELGVDVRAVDNAEECVRGADIVTAATNNDNRGGPPAVYDGEWLAPGAHVNIIGRREADAVSFRRAKVFPATMSGVLRIMPPFEPFKSLMDSGEIPPENLPGDLASVIAGSCVGRTSDDEITLYFGPSQGFQHAAIARWVYDAAVVKGLGTTWSLD